MELADDVEATEGEIESNQDTGKASSGTRSTVGGVDRISSASIVAASSDGERESGVGEATDPRGVEFLLPGQRVRENGGE